MGGVFAFRLRFDIYIDHPPETPNNVHGWPLFLCDDTAAHTRTVRVLFTKVSPGRRKCVVYRTIILTLVSLKSVFALSTFLFATIFPNAPISMRFSYIHIFNMLVFTLFVAPDFGLAVGDKNIFLG